jgi:phosphohistidine phosphatase
MHARLQNESKSVMLLGHLPYLSRLAARLVGLEADHAVVRFQMGGTVHLERDDAGRWTIAWILVPELLECAG